MAVWVVLVCLSLSGLTVATGEENAKLQKVEIKSSNLFPEGFDWDAKHGRFLVGSIALGKLVAVDKKGVVSEFVTDEDYAGRAAIAGVTVDRSRNRVLVVVRGLREAPPLAASLAAYDLDSKERILYVTGLKEHDSPGVNDVTVDYDGNAYVTDSVHNSIWKITPSGDKSLMVSSLPRQPVIMELIPELTNSDGEVNTIVPGLVNSSYANGIVHHNGYLIICQSNSGSLIRVRLSDKEVTVVSIKPEGAVMISADGMALRSDGSLIIVSYHTAWLLESKDSWRTATVVEEVPLEKGTFPTSVKVSKEGSRIFILHSYLLDYFKGLNRDSFEIQEIEFPNDAYNNPLWLLAILGMFVVLVLAWKCQVNQFNKDYNKKRA